MAKRSFSAPSAKQDPPKLCSVADCDERSKFKGFCRLHYERFQRHGDPLVHKRPDLGKTLEERFWSKVNKNGPLGCWVWTASLDLNGYGQFIVMRGSRGYPRLSHRVAWELLQGPIPNGLVIDHLCRNRACVRPDHLQPVTNKENILRGVSISAISARKTHCIRGHEFNEENTYRPKRGGRMCRACARIRRAERKSK